MYFLFLCYHLLEGETRAQAFVRETLRRETFVHLECGRPTLDVFDEKDFQVSGPLREAPDRRRGI